MKSEEHTVTDPSEVTVPALVDHWVVEAQQLAEAGVDLARIGEALVEVGLRFETLAYGPRAVAGRLAVATMAMKRIADEVDAAPAPGTVQ